MVFINGKQKRIRRSSPLVEGRPVEEWIAAAGSLWFHENELWWEMPDQDYGPRDPGPRLAADRPAVDEDDLPF